MPAAFAWASHACHIEAGYGKSSKRLRSRSGSAPLRPFWKSSIGPDWLALARVGKIVNRGHDIARRMSQIGLEIAPADNTFLGCEIDEDDRPLIEQADLGHHRPGEAAPGLTGPLPIGM